MLLKEFEEKKDEFLIYIEVEKNLTPNTLKAYKSDLKIFTKFWAQMKESTLSNVLQKFLISMFYKKLDKSSIARKLSCFKSFEKFMRTQQGIDLNLKLARPRLDKKLPIYLSIDEILYLLDDVQLKTKFPYRDAAILELLYATGIRCSELTNIKLKDIDMDNKAIKVFGKGRKERIVLLGNKAKEHLELYFKHERKPIQDINESLFLNNNNNPIMPSTIVHVLELYRSFLKINKRITPHKIRHSFATHMLSQGANIRIVQELLGHKSLSSTERYTHITPEQLAKMCDTLHPLNKIKK